LFRVQYSEVDTVQRYCTNDRW